MALFYVYMTKIIPVCINTDDSENLHGLFISFANILYFSLQLLSKFVLCFLRQSRLFAPYEILKRLNE